ncbi:MAG: tryptophan synthase subunit alpha [bacterium]
MRRILRRFQQLRERGEKALVTYVTAGDPDLEGTYEIVLEMARAGADIIEIGLPFSDPTADGPVIQAACRRALMSGTTLERVLELVVALRRVLDIPLLLFTYYNPILAYGPERFAREACGSGLDGILVVDLPPEEWDELRCHTDSMGLDYIVLVAPTTGPDRLWHILRGAQGFIYCISTTAVTGTAQPELEAVRKQIQLIRKWTNLPVMVGFGISDHNQARSSASLADGVVVGSAIVRLIEENRTEDDLPRRVGQLVARLKAGISMRLEP